MKNLTLTLGLSLLLALTMLGCETSKKGLESGARDGGASQGGSGSGGSASGGSHATGGTVATGGAAGQGGSSISGQGGSGPTATGGSIARGGGSGGGGRDGTGGATASGGATGGSGTGGSTVTGGVVGSGAAQAGGGTGPSTGGARTGGTTGSNSGGAMTGGSPGSGGRGTGGRATGGAAAGGAASGGSGAHAGGAGGIGGTAGSGSGGIGLGGFGGHKSCQSDADCGGFKCCSSLCSNTQNDILNCGGCGTICQGPDPYCNGGKCGAAPCQGSTCGTGSTCCGSQCCGAGQLCCMVTLGPSVLGCFEPVDGTCPTGCAACVCAAPSTPIATPQGERPIAELRVGDWVYSVDHGQIRPVPIKRINRQRVAPSHSMVSLRLASGRDLLVSPLHPTADGRTFRDLARGDLLDGVAIVQARTVPYDQPFTYDILPDSDTGAYFAASVLIGSTLAPSAPNPLLSALPSTPASYISPR